MIHTSKLFSLNFNDLFKGLVTAVLAAVLAWFLQMINTPGFDWVSINWGEIARIAITAGGAYLMKNFISDSKGNVLGSEIK